MGKKKVHKKAVVKQLDNHTSRNDKRKKSYTKLITILTLSATIMGVLGITVFDFSFMDLLKKDYQAIAEKKCIDGLELYNSGKYGEAIELYDDAIQLEPKGITEMEMVYFNRGMAYYKLGDYEHAIGDFTNAIQLKPKSEYYFNRANAYGQIGDTVKEIEDNLKGVALMEID